MENTRKPSVEYKSNNDKLKDRLLNLSSNDLSSIFKDDRFVNTLLNVKNDLLEGDTKSFDALMRIRRLIKRGALIPQTDIDLALSVELKNWKGADVSGRNFSELRFFDFSDANTDHLQVFGDVQKSVFKEIKGFNTHGGNIYMNKVKDGDISGCVTHGGNIEKNRMEFGDISNNDLGGGEIKYNNGVDDIENNKKVKKTKGNEFGIGVNLE